MAAETFVDASGFYALLKPRRRGAGDAAMTLLRDLLDTTEPARRK